MDQQKAVELKRKNFLLRWSGKGIFGFLVRLLYRLYNTMFDYSPYLLPFLIFAFKFAEWWYSENAGNQSKPIPAPPQPPRISERGVSLPLDKRACPLCLDTRTNAAVLSSSGFVFCYPCIHTHVTENANCPVTLLPARIEQIRKIYES